MYITKLFIDAKIPSVRHDLTSLNFFYDTLKKITGGGKPVYRIDNVPLAETDYLQPVVVVSETEPSFNDSKLAAGYIAKIETFKYDIPVRNGMNYNFYIKANPSVKILFRYSDLETEESWAEWLRSEGYSNGYEIIDQKVRGDGYITCADKNVRLISVIFEGALRITDEKKFRRAINSAISRGREYGLGLLSIESFGCKNRNIAEEMKNSMKNAEH